MARERRLDGVPLQSPTYDRARVSGISVWAGAESNPLLAIERFKHPQDINRFIGSAQARWNPLDRLTVSYTFGYDGYSLEQSEFFPRGAFPPPATAQTGLASNGINNSRILNQDAVANYLFDWNDLQLTTSGGVNYTHQRIRNTIATSTNLIPVVEVVSGGATPAAAESIVELKTFGFYAQQQIGWRDRLFLTAPFAGTPPPLWPDERWQYSPKRRSRT